ncbi:hypothetical protein Tco_0145889 [Tanacetum coccineum]
MAIPSILLVRTTTNADGTSTLIIPGPVTTEEKTQKKNDVKARMMPLPMLSCPINQMGSQLFMKTWETKIDEDGILKIDLKWQIALRVWRQGGITKGTGKKITINGSDTAGYDKSKGVKFTDNNRKGVGYNAVPPPPTGLFAPPTIDLSNSGLKEFQQPEFKGYGFKANKGVCENSSNEIKNLTGCPNY